MGLWDGKADNSLDKMFDMNKDGYLDPAERALRDEYIMNEFGENSDESGSENHAYNTSAYKNKATTSGASSKKGDAAINALIFSLIIAIPGLIATLIGGELLGVIVVIIITIIILML